MELKDGYYYLEPGESQYDGLELTKPVKARYIPADSDKERGNPLIEALPPLLSEDDALRAYSMGIPGYRHSDVKSMSYEEKRALIRQYRDIRLPLLYQQDVGKAFHDALHYSYSMRELVPVTDAVTVQKMGGKEVKPGYVSWSEADLPTFGFFCLVGTSGAGKTSTVHILRTLYPQVVTHKLTGGRLTQIVHLFVVCPSGSNLKTLYEEIGKAIDRAIGNTAHDYQHYVTRARDGLAGRAERVAELIELFSVGAIIFDEIQNLDFGRSGDHGFASLLYILNTTHVAFVCVGLPEASEKIGARLEIKRRVGDEINGSDYCDDKECFEVMVNTLFHYQVFDPPVEVTPEIVDILYQHTLGVVDFLVTIFSCMSLDYIDYKEPPAIDADFISRVLQKHYKGLPKLLKEQRYEDIYTLNETVKAGLNTVFNDSGKRETQKERLRSEDFAAEGMIRDSVIAFMEANFDYGRSAINAAFNKVIKRSKNKSEKEIKRLVMEELSNSKKRAPKKPKVKPIDVSEIQSMFMQDTKENSAGGGTGNAAGDAAGNTKSKAN